jgi:hypothetical protein
VNKKQYNSVDEVIAEIEGLSIEEIARLPWDGPRLISVDELRAAGALDVPPSWRKSLGVERGLLFDLHGDDTPSVDPASADDLDAE